MDLIKVGACVQFVGRQFYGRVLGIEIRESGVQYHVAWWDGKTRNTQWLKSFEVKAKREKDVEKIGFHN